MIITVYSEYSEYSEYSKYYQTGSLFDVMIKKTFKNGTNINALSDNLALHKNPFEKLGLESRMSPTITRKQLCVSKCAKNNALKNVNNFKYTVAHGTMSNQFFDKSKNKNVSAKTNTSIKNNILVVDSLETAITYKVVYPVKIHDLNTCKCIRIMKLISNNTIKNVTHVIEKLWLDEKYKLYPNIIFVLKSDINMQQDLLNNLLSHCENERNCIMHYFKEYNFANKNNIRQYVHQINTICFCGYSLLLNKNTCNAGIVLFGREKQLRAISKRFNTYVKHSEYSEYSNLSVTNLQSLARVNKHILGHNVITFLNSKEFVEISKFNKFTLTGAEFASNKFSFSFGKREWNNTGSETSFECAKRELYEEFHIQFSNKLYESSLQHELPQYMHVPGLILYFVYLPNSVIIDYCIEDDTIYLS